jgi:hypothetical protein
MATSDYHSSADLKAVPHQGLIHEDVMNKIWDISKIPLPFTDMISSDGVKNAYTSWTQDRLNDPDLGNNNVDGVDAAGNDAGVGARVGNHCQISTKQLQVTTRARQSDTIGRADELSYQVMMRQRECRRDVEAISLSNQASQADDGDAVPGLSAGFNAWLVTNTFRGVGGLSGGFAAGNVTAATLGTPRALTEELVRDACQAVWDNGGDPSIMMARSAVIRKFSEYMFTAEARIGNQQTETGRSGASTAVGSVNVFITDFGVSLKMVANRLMQAMDAPTTELNDSVYIFDPVYWRHGYLHGYRTEELAKVGLADKRQIAVDWTLKALNEESAAVIADVDATADVIAAAP